MMLCRFEYNMYKSKKDINNINYVWLPKLIYLFSICILCSAELFAGAYVKFVKLYIIFIVRFFLSFAIPFACIFTFVDPSTVCVFTFDPKIMKKITNLFCIYWNFYYYI